MRRRIGLLIAILMILTFTGTSVAVSSEENNITGTVTEIEKFGHAVLDITIEAFNAAGFDLGDIVTAAAGDSEWDMPYLNGYYVDRGEYMLRAFPGTDYIALCINYGKFADMAGLSIGDSVTIRMKEKAGALMLQEINNLEFSTSRDDYSSDEEFANFRSIVEGKVYRSASPVDNQNNQAIIADKLIADVGIQAIMNMENTEEEVATLLRGNNSTPYYMELYDKGNVIVLGMPVNFDSDEFAEGIVKGFSFLLDHDGPWLIHCFKGKDRAAFASMLLEMLIGWTEDELIADYMLSYINYYEVEPGTEKYNMIVERDVKEMMRAVAGLGKGESLAGIEWQAAAEDYLLKHGMDKDSVVSLESFLTQ